MQDDLDQRLRETLPVIERYLKKKAAKFYKNEDDKLNFILSSGINLVANLTIFEAKGDKEVALSFAVQVMSNLNTWFQVRFGTSKKEAH